MSNPQQLIDLIQTLRGPNGCSWDKKQRSIDMPSLLLEEVHETIEAIQDGHTSGIQEELGDLLFVLLLTCNTVEKDHGIQMSDICKDVYDKMIRRHPHIFSPQSKEQLSWEQLKQKEKKRHSVLDGISKTLPSLAYAQKQAKRAAKIGFDWPDIHGVLNKVEEEFKELKEAIKNHDQEEIEHELGDLLMSCANVGRKLKISSEFALSKATKRFKSRFQWMEKHSNTALSEVDAEELEKLWSKAKQSLENKYG